MSRHALLVGMCCTIPLGLVFALPYLGVTTRSFGLLLLIVMLCPLLPLLWLGRHGTGRGGVGRGNEGRHG